MADKKISELTELTTPDGTEELVVNDSGVSKKITQANLLRGINNTAADATAITIDASENVGIGTNSPDTKLHVDGGDVKISSDVQSSNGDGIPTIFFGEDTTALVAAQISYHGDDESGDNNFIGIGCNGATPASEAVTKENHQMVIKASGNIGIGTTSPEALLHVQGATTGQMMFRTGGSSVNKWLVGKDSSADFTFVDDGVEMLRIIRDTGGITFNGDTAAANALDDYEEGTWSPTMRTGNSAAWTNVFTENSFTKIGSLVTISLAGTMTATGTTPMSNLYAATAVPFTPKTYTPLVGYGAVVGGGEGGMRFVNTALTYPITLLTTVVPAKTVGQTLDYKIFLQYQAA